jgi:hypothetical protein
VNGLVGLGYVGLPLAAEFPKARFAVVGIDISQEKTRRVIAGESYVGDVSAPMSSSATIYWRPNGACPPTTNWRQALWTMPEPGEPKPGNDSSSTSGKLNAAGSAQTGLRGPEMTWINHRHPPKPLANLVHQPSTAHNPTPRSLIPPSFSICVAVTYGPEVCL